MQTASTTSRNIKTISELEQSASTKRSFSARVGDAIASHAGKMWFIVFHLIWFGLWLWFNSGSKGKAAFDPFPYQLLSTIVSLESIFLSLFILNEPKPEHYPGGPAQSPRTSDQSVVRG